MTKNDSDTIKNESYGKKFKSKAIFGHSAGGNAQEQDTGMILKTFL